jgi:hypothetical protein
MTPLLLALVLAAVTPEPNLRQVTAEAPIVAGNAASAKERAMADAFRQAVERSIAAVFVELVVPEPLPPALADLRASLLTRPKRFIRSYRLVEEQEVEGRLRVIVDPDVDQMLLRREIDRVRGVATAPVRGATSLSLLITGTPVEATLALAKALTGLGAKAQTPPVGAMDEAHARELAHRLGASAVLLTGDLSSEGVIRGTTKQSVLCRFSARILAAVGPTSDRSVEARRYAEREESARADCLAGAATELAPQLIEALGPAVGSSVGGAVTLDLDLVEPAALPLVSQAFRRIASVSSAEVRRVAMGSVELRVSTRMGLTALVAALTRELGTFAEVSSRSAAPDRALVTIRLVAPVVPAPASPSPSASQVGVP